MLGNVQIYLLLTGLMNLSPHLHVLLKKNACTEHLTFMNVGSLKDGIVPLQLMQDEGLCAIEGFPGVSVFQV